ncbi:MAG: hypothetical protein QF744_15035 [SAR202 cluster bacterium]|jgi:hypothetical protein|nr:hypothetical protein [SAR202 cluster bacterium]
MAKPTLTIEARDLAGWRRLVLVWAHGDDERIFALEELDPDTGLPTGGRGNPIPTPKGS